MVGKDLQSHISQHLTVFEIVVIPFLVRGDFPVFEDFSRHSLVLGVDGGGEHGGCTLFGGVDQRTEEPVTELVHHLVVHIYDAGTHDERVGNVETDSLLFPCLGCVQHEVVKP